MNNLNTSIVLYTQGGQTMPYSNSRVLKRPNSNIAYKTLNSFTLYSLMGKYAERGEHLMYTYLKNILIERGYLG